MNSFIKNQEKAMFAKGGSRHFGNLAINSSDTYHVFYSSVVDLVKARLTFLKHQRQEREGLETILDKEANSPFLPAFLTK